MKAPYYIVSDNHFCMDDSDFEQKRRKKLFDIFEKIKQLGGTLIIGGDFFDYWFEYDNVIPKGYESILSSFCDMTKNNIDPHSHYYKFYNLVLNFSRPKRLIFHDFLL